MADFRTIPLTQGQVAIVDAEDYERLNQFEWYAAWYPKAKAFYALRGDYSSGRRITISMHREIMHATKGQLVDHKDGATLDNRKGISLRIATRSQNGANRKIHANNASGFKGVCKQGNRWGAMIRKDRKLRHLGYFSTPEAAHEAYKQAARIVHGEFARAS